MKAQGNPKLKTTLLALSFAGLLAVPLLAAGVSDEIARLLAESWWAYAAFVALVAGASALHFMGPRAAAVAVSALLLVGGFLFFYYLPWIVLPMLAFLGASLTAPPSFRRGRGTSSA